MHETEFIADGGSPSSSIYPYLEPDRCPLVCSYSFFQTLEYLPHLFRKMAENTKFDSLKKLFPIVSEKMPPIKGA